MNNNNHTLFYIKILHGVNKGATADLDDDPITVGSCDDSDIILSGLATKEKRIEIYPKNGSFFIKALNQSFNLDDIIISLSDEDVLLKPFQIIDIGGCRFTICKRGEEQPNDLDLKYFPVDKLKRQKKPSALSHFIKPYALKNASNTQEMLLSSIVVFMLLGWVLLANFETPAVASSYSSVEPVAPSAISKPFMINAFYEKLDEQTVTQQNCSSLEQEVNEKTPLKQNILSNKNLAAIKSAKKEAYLLLRAYGVNRINLQLSDAGLLSAKGYVGDDKNWEKAKTSILGDINEINEVDDKEVETFITRSIALKNILKEESLKTSLIVDIDDEKNTLHVSGELTKSDIRKWKIIKAKFIKDIGKEPTIKESIIDIENNIHLSIRSVNIGQTSYFVSKAGKKYMVGSDLGSGYQVLGIGIDKITLLYKSKRIEIFYNNLINENQSNPTRSRT